METSNFSALNKLKRPGSQTTVEETILPPELYDGFQPEQKQSAGINIPSDNFGGDMQMAGRVWNPRGERVRPNVYK